MLERQGSCRIFKGLNQNSPFKRQLSLRFTPSQMERQRKSSLQQQDDSLFNKSFNNFNNRSNLTTETTENQDKNDLSAMCKYMTENLTMLSNKQDLFDDNFQFNNFNNSKSPSVIAKINPSTSTSKTSTPGRFSNISLTLIEI